MPRSRRSLACLCSILLPLALATSAGAVEVRAGEPPQVPAGETLDGDLYVSGETVVIEGTVKGDVVAAGRLVEVHGSIEGDLIAAGQAIEVTGTVLDDARLAGQALRISGDVGGHIVAFGFSLEATEESRIGEDLLFNGGQLRLAGELSGNLDSSTAAARLEGRIGGDVDLRVGPQGDPAPRWFWQAPIEMPQVRGGLTVEDGARIDGDLTYRSPSEAALPADAVVGEIDARIAQVEEEEERSAADLLVSRLRRLAALLALGFLLLWRLPAATRRPVEVLAARPLVAAGWGLLGTAGLATLSLFLVVLGVAAALLLGLLQLGNLSLPVLLLAILGSAVIDVGLVVGLLYLAQVVVGLGVGTWILGRLRPGASAYAALGLGVLIYVLAGTIPMVGLPIRVVVAVLGLGAMSTALVEAWRRRRGAKAA